MIKKYTPTDIDICVPVFIDVFKNEPWNYDWITNEKIYKYFNDLQNTPGFLGLLHYDIGELTGFCFGLIYDYFANNTYDIKEILVKRKYQRKGIGTAMLAEVENYLKTYDMKIITLTTQRKIPAFEFYKKNAYSVSDGSVYMYKII